MINQLVRYLPIIDYIKKNKPAAICEVGSGSYGIGKFLKIPFIGCDNSFTDYSKNDQRKNPGANNLMEQIKCSAIELPFEDNRFDFVFSLDTFEHLSSDERIKSFLEMRRISNKTVMIGFPQGIDAKKIDKMLDSFYHFLGKESPTWLKEHLDGEYPNDDLILFFKQNYIEFTEFKNENLLFHLLLLAFESLPGGSIVSNLFSGLYLKIPQFYTELFLSKLISHGKCYRKIFFLTK